MTTDEGRIPEGRSTEEQFLIDHFDHPNPDLLVNIAGGWWRIWPNFYYQLDEQYCLSRMTNGQALYEVSVLHSEPGFTGRIIAIENTDYAKQKWENDAPMQPDRGPTMSEWMREWMESNPDGVPTPVAAPERIRDTSLVDAFTRMDSEWMPETNVDGDDYISYVNGGNNRGAIIRITPDQGMVLRTFSPPRDTMRGCETSSRLSTDEWRAAVSR